MKTYIENAKTNPETTDEELLRMAEEYAEMEEEGRKVRRDELCVDDEMKRRGRRDEELSLDRLICEADPGTNVAQLLNDIKHETVDDDLQNLDPGFLQVVDSLPRLSDHTEQEYIFSNIFNLGGKIW